MKKDIFGIVKAESVYLRSFLGGIYENLYLHGQARTICQNRAITISKKILNKYKGQKVVIGTHGAVMTMMMEYFDRQYDLDFLLKTSKPGIYRMEFDEEVLMETERLWKATPA